MEFRHLFDKVKEETCKLHESPVAAPEAPTKPDAPSRETPSPTRKKNPVVPVPGIKPKPKAEKNNDLRLFKKLRMDLNEMAFDSGKTSKFIHKHKQDWIETGDSQLDALFPSLPEGAQTYLEVITSETYKDLINRLERYLGVQVEDMTMPSILAVALNSLQKVLSIESNHKEYLEQLALKSVLDLDEFTLIKDAYENEQVGFDVQLGEAELDLLGEAELDLNVEDEEIEEDGLTEEEKLNLRLAAELDELDETMLKRRFANLLIQGNSTLKLYLFNLVADKLNKLDPNLLKHYGIVATFAQLGYWLAPNGLEQSAVENGAGGSSEVIPEDDIYIIKARGIVFPYLIHEIVKGAYEWISISEEVRNAMKQDTIEKETEDIIAGPGVAKAVMSYLNADQMKLLPLVKKSLILLPSEDIKEVLYKSVRGKDLMADIIAQAGADFETYYEEEQN